MPQPLVSEPRMSLISNMTKLLHTSLSMQGPRSFFWSRALSRFPRFLQHSCWKPRLSSLFWDATSCHKSRSAPTSQGCTTLPCLLASCMAAILGNSYFPPRFQGDTRVSPGPPSGLPGTESGSRITSLNSPRLHLPSVGMLTGTPVGKGCLCSTQGGTCWQLHWTGIELWCPKHRAPL